MANSGDPSTFTFTIDAFPAYTKFNKRKKVMAALQIIDPTIAGHNYADKSVIGHEKREHGVDIYGEGPEEAKDIDKIYNYSIFDADNSGRASSSTDDQGGDSDTDDQDDTTTKTYVVATEFNTDVVYYSDDQGTVADPQPADAEEFEAGTYYIEQ